VQRVIRDPGHCGFTTTEVTASFRALVRWVEQGHKPAGNDVLHDDLSAPDPRFELIPRPGTPEARRVTGAHDRVVIRGTATVDGRPLDARFVGADVVHDGLTSACQLELSPAASGAFELTVAADAEVRGCGAPGSTIVFWTYVGATGTQLTELHTTNPLPWPGNGATISPEVTFSTADPRGASVAVMGLVGEVLDGNGRYAGPGTRVEAFAGRTRCGASATPRTGSYSGYVMAIAGPDAVPGCTANARLTFRIDGHPATQTATIAPDAQQTLDLTATRPPR
jgi:hypothetical protein